LLRTGRELILERHQPGSAFPPQSAQLLAASVGCKRNDKGDQRADDK
jgi:hypothetical protein